jgi:hypothetical protein
VLPDSVGGAVMLVRACRRNFMQQASCNNQINLTTSQRRQNHKPTQDHIKMLDLIKLRSPPSPHASFPFQGLI